MKRLCEAISEILVGVFKGGEGGTRGNHSGVTRRSEI